MDKTMDYLGLPFRLSNGYLERVDIAQSIRQSVGLILCTRAGSMPILRDYGCDLWEREYSDMLTANRGDVRASLRNSISKYETRLINVSVSFSTSKDVRVHALGVEVKVTGIYRDEANEEQKFEASYSLG